MAGRVVLLRTVTRCSINRRTFASATPPPKLPSIFRLPRPGTKKKSSSDSSQHDLDRGRAHAITVFPGDFQDDGESIWDDDGEGSDIKGDETELMRQEMRRRVAEEKAKREKWIKNSIPPSYTPQIDERSRSFGRGGRKTASSRVWIQPGMGEIVVNKRPFVEYFLRLSDRELILQPLVATETCGAFDVQVVVQGGGLTGQAGAVRHGLARALNAFNPDKYRPPMKRLGLLERDYRKVERKKVGRVKARKSPQWVRR
jgi:small subunit ribosomal protein S9